MVLLKLHAIGHEALDSLQLPSAGVDPVQVRKCVVSPVEHGTVVAPPAAPRSHSSPVSWRLLPHTGVGGGIGQLLESSMQFVHWMKGEAASEQ